MLNQTCVFSITTTNTNDNMPKLADDDHKWIVMDTNDRSQLDQWSESEVKSDKSLIHDCINFSEEASLPAFHGIDKVSYKPDGQGSTWTVDTNNNDRDQHLYYYPRLIVINLISPTAIVQMNKKHMRTCNAVRRRQFCRFHKIHGTQNSLRFCHIMPR